jgi:hypothetical protein
MQNDETNPARTAKEKMLTGALMTLDEVAATLDLSPQTVHALPLASIRLGRLLRFDPRDVRKLINKSKEPSIAHA